MIPAADRWGPFVPDIDPAEQRAQLRALRVIVRLLTGPRGAELATLLRRAEQDPAALEAAVAALNRLASIDRRQVLASFIATHRAA
ncbi:hypothetical protein [Methylobacterium sp. A54F]